LKQEKEVFITEEVKIVHPTDLIILPILKSRDELKSGEIWQLSAKGGSGYYHWSIEDPKIATISGSGLLKSESEGITTITVRDSLNQKNYK
jgi:hypothetical protein